MKYQTREQQTKWVSRCKGSGLPARLFAKRHGLREANLYCWRQRLAGGSAAKGPEAKIAFAEVHVARLVRPRAGQQSRFEVELPNDPQDRLASYFLEADSHLYLQEQAFRVEIGADETELFLRQDRFAPKPLFAYGKPVPELTLRTETSFAPLAKHKGIRLLDVASRYCGFCARNIPELKALHHGYPALDIVTLFGDSPEESSDADLAAHLNELKLPWTSGRMLPLANQTFRSFSNDLLVDENTQLISFTGDIPKDEIAKLLGPAATRPIP